MASLPNVRELRARVASAVLGEVLDYWTGFFDRGVVPSFDDVEPWQIKRALPYIWIWRRDARPDGSSAGSAESM